jgi:hypothetical protein
VRQRRFEPFLRRSMSHRGPRLHDFWHTIYGQWRSRICESRNGGSSRDSTLHFYVTSGSKRELRPARGHGSWKAEQRCVRQSLCPGCKRI